MVKRKVYVKKLVHIKQEIVTEPSLANKQRKTGSIYLRLVGGSTMREHQHAVQLRAREHLAGLVQHGIEEVGAADLAVGQRRRAVDLAVAQITVGADEAVADNGAGYQLHVIADNGHVEAHVTVVAVVLGALGFVHHDHVIVVVIAVAVVIVVDVQVAAVAVGADEALVHDVLLVLHVHAYIEYIFVIAEFERYG